jgi:hypothetical protein
MAERDLSYAAWQARRGRSATRRARLDAGLPPYSRQRLRGEAEARVLRRMGTPAALIGPIGTEDEIARERNELVEFARRLRSTQARG